MKSPSSFGSLRWVLLAACCLSATLAPPAARAEPLSPDARAQFRKAYKVMGEEHWAEEKELLLDLWNKQQTYDVAEALSHVEFQLRNYAESARYINFAVDYTPPVESTKVLEGRRVKLADAKSRVGTVDVVVGEPGAEIVVDDKLVGTSPLKAPVFLEPGAHQLRARAASGSAEERLEVVAGKAYSVTLTLRPLTSQQQSTGTGVQVVPVTPAQPTASEHPAGKTTTWAPAVITGGLAVVAFGVGTGFAVDAKSATSSSADRLRDAGAQFGQLAPCAAGHGAGSDVCNEISSLQDRRDHSKQRATISFVLGGVLAGAAVGSYFLWARPTKENQAPQLSAWLGGEGGGVQLFGSFQ